MKVQTETVVNLWGLCVLVCFYDLTTVYLNRTLHHIQLDEIQLDQDWQQISKLCLLCVKEMDIRYKLGNRTVGMSAPLVLI